MKLVSVGGVVFMPSETTHSPPDFHGGCGRREKQDEKLKCATHAFKHVLYTCCIVRPQCFGINYLCRGVYRLGFTVFIIVSMASFQAVLMRTTESLRVPGNIQEEMIQRTIIYCNVIHCSMTGHNMTEHNIYK